MKVQIDTEVKGKECFLKYRFDKQVVRTIFCLNFARTTWKGKIYVNFKNKLSLDDCIFLEFISLIYGTVLECWILSKKFTITDNCILIYFFI